jgi:hypothetical protein
MHPIRIPRLARIGFAGVIASLALAAPASAATGSCGGSLGTPFSPWGDTNLYTLAPHGDMESGSGWTFAGGAKLVSGSEPFKATGKLGVASLAIPTGGSATTPPICLSINHPTFRFFARAAQGAAASLRAEAATRTPYLQVVGLGAVNGTTAWAPAPALSTGAESLILDPTGTISVRIRLTADYGSWNVDDVFVDPRKMG